MSIVSQILLTVCYGLAWSWSSYDPPAGLLFLSAIGTLISLPKIFESVIAGIIISALLTAIVVLFPCCAPILGLWFIIKVLAKIAEIINNLILLIASSFLYGILLYIPLATRIRLENSITDADSTWLVPSLMVVIGALIMQAICSIFALFGHKSSKTVAFIVGLPGFLIMLIIFLFTLDGGEDGADGTDDK
jgi:hypothetical protein